MIEHIMTVTVYGQDEDPVYCQVTYGYLSHYMDSIEEDYPSACTRLWVFDNNLLEQSCSLGG